MTTRMRHSFRAAAILPAAALSLSTAASGIGAQGAPATAASPARAFDLSVANIMRGPELYGREPSNVAWSADGAWIYFQWAPPGSKWNDPVRPYRVRAAGGAPERVSDAHMDTVAASLADGPTTRDGRTRAVASRGDLYLLDTRTGTTRRLTETVAAESDPRFSADERSLLFTREGNAYALTLATGAVRQLTDIRTGPAPRDSVRPTGARGALERDQRDLLEVVRDRARADSIARAEREAADSRRLRPVYLPAGERAAGLSVSPSLRTAVLLTASNPPGAPRLTQVPTYVTASGFTEEIGARTKVGEGNVRFRAYRLDLATGRLQQLHAIDGDSTRAASQIRTVGWSDDGTLALLSANTPDFKWRYIVTVGDTGRPRVVEALRDSAWIGGPCNGCMGWLPNGRVWYVSEATGFAQLYTAGADGSGRTPVTEGITLRGFTEQSSPACAGRAPCSCRSAG